MKVKGLQGYLLFAILGGFVAWMIWGQPKIDVDIESYELKIQLLEQRIDSIQNQNAELKLEADSLYTRIDSYDIEINKLNARIYVIKEILSKMPFTRVIAVSSPDTIRVSSPLLARAAAPDIGQSK